MLLWLMVLMLPGPLQDERLVWPEPQGFVVAHQEKTASAAIKEQVPEGETIHNWTIMITQIHREAIGPLQFALRMAASWKQICPGAKATRPLAGRLGVDTRLDCPRNPRTNKPETMFQRTISGQGRLHILQVAFRALPTKREVAGAKAELEQARLCRAASREPACLLP
jgi:hypothetical protein